MKTVYQGVYFGLTALLLCPAISLAAEVDYGGHLKYFISYSDFPDKSVFAGSVLFEMTPLLQLNPTLFINPGDGRGMLQFIGTYSLAQNFDLLAGFNLPAGPDGSQFRGALYECCRRSYT